MACSEFWSNVRSSTTIKIVFDIISKLLQRRETRRGGNNHGKRGEEGTDLPSPTTTKTPTRTKTYTIVPHHRDLPPHRRDPHHQKEDITYKSSSRWGGEIERIYLCRILSQGRGKTVAPERVHTWESTRIPTITAVHEG